MQFRIEPLRKGYHSRGSFRCGRQSLDRYLHRQASQDLNRKLAAVFVLFEPPRKEILAYYTLSAYSIGLTDLEPRLAKRLPRYPRLPATLLGRLAVDEQQQGRGLGELILVDALRRSLQAASEIASLAVVAEAIDEQAVTFYKNYNFQPFQDNPMHLYLPMAVIQKLYQETEG